MEKTETSQRWQTEFWGKRMHAIRYRIAIPWKFLFGGIHLNSE